MKLILDPKNRIQDPDPQPFIYLVRTFMSSQVFWSATESYVDDGLAVKMFR